MAFLARYRGTCAACSDAIEVGDLLRYNADDEVIHVACKEPIRAAREVCTECFLEKPCGCDDGQ